MELCSKCNGNSDDECQTKGGENCVFPFRYNGNNYYGCTIDGSASDYAWCATSVDGNGNVGNWDQCKAGTGCPKASTGTGISLLRWDLNLHLLHFHEISNFVRIFDFNC